MANENSSGQTVFISHAGTDADFATRLAESLEKMGITPRLDQLEIRLGDNIVTWMNDAIAESDYLLLLLSPDSVDRYWVKTEWSNALIKEAQLRRTFVIPVVLPGLDDSQIPALLQAKAYLDFRGEEDAALLKLVSHLKSDQLIEREVGSFPSPAPPNMVAHVRERFEDEEGLVEVVVHSNRFGRCFRIRVPRDATPSYLMGMLRDTLNLKYSNVDNSLGVELSYTYCLRHNGKAITLRKTMEEAGVKDGDRLELWIKVTLRDLVEDKEIGGTVFRHLYRASIDSMTPEVRKARKRAFASSEIARIASQFFEHVDA